MLVPVAHHELHPSALTRGRVERHHVAQVNRGVLLDAPTLLVSLRRSHVLPNPVNSFDDHAKAKHESDDHESNDRDSDDPVSTSTSTTSTSSTTTAVNPTVPRGHDCDDQNEHEVDHEDAKDTRPVVSGNAIGGNSGQHGGNDNSGGGRD